MKINATHPRLIHQCLVTSIITCIIILFGCNDSQAQVDGDYRSLISGNWNDATTWQVRAGGAWTTATGVPTAANNVYVQNTHTVTLNTSISSTDGLCNDLHINTLGVLAISSTNNVNVSGKIRAYTGAAEVSAADGSYIGTSSTAPSGISTGSTGVLKFVGASRNITNAGEWNSTFTGTTANVEFALNAGATGTLLTGIKFKRITITACIVTTATFIAVGTAATDFIKITAGAKLISSRSGAASSLIGGSGTTKCGIVQIDEGGILELTGTVPTLDCTTFTNNGTVLYSRGGTQTLLAPNTSATDGPITLPNYSNLIVSGSGAKTIPAGLTINVSNSFSLAGSSTAILANGGSSALTYGAGATLVDSSSSSIALAATSLEWPSTNGPANVRVVSNILSFAASAAISRTITGSLSLNGGNFTVNTSNTLTFANGSSVIRSSGALNISSGTILHGVLPTDLVNVVINYNCTNSGEISAGVTPGKIGTLTLASGVSYTNTGSRSVTNLVNNGILVLTPSTTLTLFIAGTVSGSGTITSNLSTANTPNYYSSSLSFTGSSPAGTLLMTPGLNTVRNFTLNNSGGLSLGNTIKVDTTLILTTGTLTTGGNLTLGNGTSIVRTAGAISAAPVFGTSVNVTYNDVAATTTGLELPASSTILNNLTINNSNGVLLSNSPTVNGTLNLTSGFLSIGSNSLTINAAVGGAGTLTGSSASNLIIGGAAGTLNFTQASAATRSLNNFTLNGISATLGTALNIYSVLTVTAGTLDLNAQAVTLKSTSVTNTARVAPITGTLNGASNVTVERYIADPGHRAWHLLSAQAVTGAQTIYDSWQESGVNNNGYGTLVSSNLYNGSNGFDISSGSASVLTHDQATPAWEYNMAGTNASAISAKQGYMLFVRGDRTYTPTLPTPTASGAAILRTKGTLTQGMPSVTVASGSGRTLVGNPFASPIDMETVFTGNPTLSQDMYVWDPSATGSYGVGAFVLVERSGGGVYSQTPFPLQGSSTVAPNSRYIHSGQAFFLKSTGAAVNVVFNESMKAAGLSVVNPIVNIARDQQIFANLAIVQAGADASLADGIRVRYDASYSVSVRDDIEKMGNFAENLSSYRESKKLIVEKRPMIGSKDTIFLRSGNLGIKDYRFQVGTIDFVQSGVTAWLEDTYKGSKTALDLKGSINNIDFSVTADGASANPDRFRIVFEAVALPVPAPASITTVKAAQQNNSIAVDWKVTNQQNIAKYELEKSTDGLWFKTVETKAATGINGTVNYNWLDVTAMPGDNIYRVLYTDLGGVKKYSELAKVNMGSTQAEITIYPNPVTDKKMQVKFAYMNEGTYQLKLISANGQTAFVKEVKHPGGTSIV